MTRRPPFLDEPTPRLRAWFDAPDHAAWRAAAERTRSDPDATRRLGHDIALSPLAPTSAGHAVQERHARKGAWDIRALVEHGSLDEAKAIIDDSLDAGATSVWIHPTGGARGLASGDGLPLLPEHLEALLADVDLAVTPLQISGGLNATAWYDAVRALAERRGTETWVSILDDLAGSCFANDVPLPASAWDAAAERVRSAGPNHRVLGLSTVAWDDAGATTPQQLGLLLAAMAELLRELDSRGVSPGDAAPRLTLQVSVGTRTFIEMAAMRAVRDLSARLLELCSVDAEMLIHAVSSRAAQSPLDPWSNALRGTSAVFAAAVGGADAITMRPHDAIRGPASAVARRLGTTGQVVLAKESHIARCVDPAAGSGHLEQLTESLSAAAWQVFQDIEALGGLTAAVGDGTVATWLAAARARSEGRLASRRDLHIGTNAFPDPDTPPMATPGRVTYGWEALRVRAATGTPHATIVTVGNKHRARVNYSEQVFAAGGFTTSVGAPIRGIAVVAGSNEDLAESLPTLAPELRAQGAAAVIVAGPAHEAADGTIAAGTDLLSTFHACLDALGVSA